MRIDILARRWGSPDGGPDGMAIASSFLAFTLCELGHDVHGYMAQEGPPPWSHPRMEWRPRVPLYAPDDWTADLVITTSSPAWRRTAACAAREGALSRLMYWHHYGGLPESFGARLATPTAEGYETREWTRPIVLPPSSWAAEAGGEIEGGDILIPGASRGKGGPLALEVARALPGQAWYVIPGRSGEADLAPWRRLQGATVAPPRTAPGAFLSRAGAVLSPTVSETYGLTMVEAAVRGAVVVCSDLPGPRAALGSHASYVSRSAPAAEWLRVLRLALGRPRQKLARTPYAEVVAMALFGGAGAVAAGGDRRYVRPTSPARLAAARAAEAAPPPRVRRASLPVSVPSTAPVDVSVILGTVNRPDMLRGCVESVRASLAGSGLSHEHVVAYGREDDVSLTWMREQPDVRPILGGMEGAIEAFNRAYAVSVGASVLIINDDVTIDGDSIPRAGAHLAADPTCAGVVFEFDRGGGRGYELQRLGGSLHPNFILARRSTCEAVVERIGGIWGDAAHRTDKTYGGDSAFGAICHHLNLRLDAVEGVTCRDLLADDDLRASNKVAPDHWSRWNAAYKPLFQSPHVEPAADEWPRLYLPREGMAPRRSPVESGRPLRLLHLSQAYSGDMQEELHRQLARIGPTVALPWHGREAEATRAAAEHRPDLIFAQIQADNWTSEWAASLRRAAGPGCTLLLWTGDVRTSASQRLDPYLIRAGRLFDLVLADSTTYPRKLALDEGATAACGYLQCGVDPNLNPWNAEAEESWGAVFMGQNYDHLDGGDRARVMQAVSAALPGVLDVYGGGWSAVRGVSGHNFVEQFAASGLMRRAAVTICTSLFQDLGRYTSDRLKRAMCSGAVVAVRRFPDMAGLGLVEGDNCLGWDSAADLIALLRDWLRPERAADRYLLRLGAQSLAHRRFTQANVAEELLAIVRDYRARKGVI